jgi:hypothetical protein
MYSSYTFLSSVLDEGEWSASRPGRALPPVTGTPVPIVQEAGWVPEPVWTQRLEEKSFAPAGDRTQIARSDTILPELPRLLTYLVYQSKLQCINHKSWFVGNSLITHKRDSGFDSRLKDRLSQTVIFVVNIPPDNFWNSCSK